MADYGTPTTNHYHLPLYAPDHADVWDGYNDSMNLLDAMVFTNETDIDELQRQMADIADTADGVTTLAPRGIKAIKANGGFIIMTDVAPTAHGAAKKLTYIASADLSSAIQTAAVGVAMQRFQPKAITGTVPTTLANVRVTDLKGYDATAGVTRLREGVFCITNGGEEAVSLAAETVFLTGLTPALKANDTYTAFLNFDPTKTVTLETGAKGNTLNLTTALELPANSTTVVYVLANA